MNIITYIIIWLASPVFVSSAATSGVLADAAVSEDTVSTCELVIFSSSAPTSGFLTSAATVLSACDGFTVGACVGAVVLPAVFVVSCSVAACVGAAVGVCVGSVVGATVGACVGFVVGASVGACVGSVVGASVEPVNAIPLDTST